MSGCHPTRIRGLQGTLKGAYLCGWSLGVWAGNGLTRPEGPARAAGVLCAALLPVLMMLGQMRFSVPEQA